MNANHEIQFLSSWEDYKIRDGSCPSCEWNDKLGEAKLENETEQISALHCPSCETKLALISNEATHAEIRAFAEAGSLTAQAHVDQCLECGGVDVE